MTDVPPPLRDEAAAIVALAAHELKNVVGALSVALSRCEQAACAGETVSPGELAPVREEVRRLSLLINALLDGARVDLGSLDLNCAPTDLVDLVRRGVDTFRRTSGRDVALSLSPMLAVEPDPDPDVPLNRVAVTTCDGEMVRAALMNLLQNASRYTPPDARIAVHLGPVDSGRAWRIVVEDSGPGISADVQAQLFQPFFRGPEAAARVKGAGLGLFLSRAIARAHGGDVGVVSAPEAGSKFWIDVPVARPA